MRRSHPPQFGRAVVGAGEAEGGAPLFFHLLILTIGECSACTSRSFKISSTYHVRIAEISIFFVYTSSADNSILLSTYYQAAYANEGTILRYFGTNHPRELASVATEADKRLRRLP